MSTMNATSTSKALADLRAARAVLADPAHWCRHHFATDTEGLATMWGSPQAARFCAVGALKHVMRTPACDESLRGSPAQAVLDDVAFGQWGATIVEVNDQAGYLPVLAAYDAAIALLERREKLLEQRDAVLQTPTYEPEPELVMV